MTCQHHWVNQQKLWFGRICRSISTNKAIERQTLPLESKAPNQRNGNPCRLVLTLLPRMLQEKVAVRFGPTNHIAPDKTRRLKFLDPVSDRPLRGSESFRNLSLVQPSRHKVFGIIRVARILRQQAIEELCTRADFKASDNPVGNCWSREVFGANEVRVH